MNSSQMITDDLPVRLDSVRPRPLLARIVFTVLTGALLTFLVTCLTAHAVGSPAHRAGGHQLTIVTIDDPSTQPDTTGRWMDPPQIPTTLPKGNASPPRRKAPASLAAGTV
jgi:hypothetical protein